MFSIRNKVGRLNRVRTMRDGMLHLFQRPFRDWYDPVDSKRVVMDDLSSDQSALYDGTCCVGDGAQLRNGMWVGIDKDYTAGLRTASSLEGPWQEPANPGSLLDLVVLLDGSILGVGLDNCLVQKSSVDAAWVSLSDNPENCGIKSIAQLHNGTLLAVNMAGELKYRQYSYHQWSAPIATGIQSITTSVPTGASPLADVHGCCAAAD